ncbi:LysR family transcriptional regulator [Kineosporia succinea]|uniref:DNA-binding transcriptional LysR family regulator n=1 Tax=Kineosporia succinea TaxID=84632 RepID=A0ABT9P5F4_9ACTN|nr:LysR family transcriptional regulator [Kineosporia succinea]MDP9827920.1 DNA-binding transcriptional LysR family regulator [Kineosporia succinea]
MTPAQLRAFTAIVRLGSVRKAAADLGVTEAAVSAHVGQLRKELGDRLFAPTASGLAFTPGGLRLASRSAELLGLQDRTVLEVSRAGSGRRFLRVAASSLFAEHCAPGLLELFAGRARDLDVELGVHSPREFSEILLTRSVDVAIGPRPPDLDGSVSYQPFLNFQVVLVAGPQHPLSQVTPSPGRLRDQTWLLGPSAIGRIGLVPDILQRLQIPEERQQIFQSHVAAVEEVKRGKGLTLALAFAVRQEISRQDLVRLTQPAIGTWGVMSLTGTGCAPEAAEFTRFVATPRATQAMLRGAGVTAGRFRPSIHVTLWN